MSNQGGGGGGDDIEKDAAPSAPSAASGPGVVRFRSRFPKPQPNIAISSGMARIRRLSGHFSNNTQPLPPPQSPHQSEQINEFSSSDKNISSSINSLTSIPLSTLTAKQQSSVENLSTSLTPHLEKEMYSDQTESNNLKNRLSISKINSPCPKSSIEEFLSNPGTPVSVGHTPLRQILSQPSTAPHTPAPNIIMPTTPGGSAYNPQFSSEHIMNIIKHKALQKLKKIESDTLKERRRKYLIESSSDTIEKQKPTENERPLPASNLDRSKIRMRDLLYFNSRNSKKNESNGDTSLSSLDNNEITSSTSSRVDENETILSIEDVALPLEEISIESVPSATKSIQFAAPQLKFAEDGSIIINEESLIVQRYEAEPVFDSTVVESEQIDNLTYNSYRKCHHTKKWTERETAKFYKALSMIGTDFTMIQKLFSNRSRDELKRKFKREEKINQALIDKILSKTSKIDLSAFVSASSDEEKNKKIVPEKNKKKSKEINETANTNTEEQDKEKTDSASINDQSSQNLSNEKKKQKLKRIKKRAFIESESEDETEKKSNNLSLINQNETEKLPFKEKPSSSKKANLNEQHVIDSINRVVERFNQKTEKETSEELNDESNIQSSIMTLNFQEDSLPPLSTLLNENNQTPVCVIQSSVMFNMNEVKNETSETLASTNYEQDNNDDEEEILVLDLDQNIIISKDSIMNVDFKSEDFYNEAQQIISVEPSQQIISVDQSSNVAQTSSNATDTSNVSYVAQSKDEKIDSDESDQDADRCVILDLDNNTIISKDSIINVDYKPVETQNEKNKKDEAVDTNYENKNKNRPSLSKIVIRKKT